MRKKGINLLGFVIIVISLTCAATGNAFSQNISRDPSDLAPYGATPRPNGATVTLVAHERTGTLDAGPDGVVDTGDDVRYGFFTFGHDENDPTTGKVPGPFIRAKQGNTITFKLKNPGTNAHTHSIDLHAVMGFMGGATVLKATPGNEATLTVELMHGGLFMYHCVGEGASNIPSIATHISNGMYGMILVEPKGGGGLFKADVKKAEKEFYVMQSEFYTTAPTCCAVGSLDIGKGLAEHPDYVVFNGRAGVERTTLTFNPSGNIVTPVVMSVSKGDDVVVYFGNMGPNHISSPHMIGGMWDREYHQGDVQSKPLRSIATATVPAAGTAVFAFEVPQTPESPSIFVLVDHAVFRVAKGALGLMIAP